ncbi:hypothetical protein RP20_CCG018980 [Aedes albopictus]|nr:hypothetical protein RP20_CCG018980 [Aedes albopictus]
MLKVISGVKTGSHPQTLNSIYVAIIRSVMEYGCSVTNNAGKTNKQLLNVVNNQCLRKVTGCTRSTPLNALTALAGQEPLEERFNYVTGKSIARCFERNNVIAEQLRNITEIEDGDEGKYSYVERMYYRNKQLYDNIMTVEAISTKSQEAEAVEITSTLEGIVGHKKSNLAPTRMKQAALVAMNETYCGRGRIFTDASKADGVCGIGVYIEDVDVKRSFKLEGDISITAAEIHALGVALQFVEEGQLLNYVIYTDSMTACLMLEEARDFNRAETVLAYVLETARKWRISFQWIPSHVGIAGNEVADQLAREGVNQTTVLEHQLFAKDVMRQIKVQTAESAQRWYQEYSQEKGIRFFTLHQKLHDKPWYHGKSFGGRDIRLLNRIMTGHNYAKSWLARMKIVESGDCELCAEEETAEHSILTCPRYNSIRARYSFGNGYSELVEVFKTKSMELYKELVDFVKECKLDL